MEKTHPEVVAQYLNQELRDEQVADLVRTKKAAQQLNIQVDPFKSSSKKGS